MRTTKRRVSVCVSSLVALLVVPSMAQYQRPITPEMREEQRAASSSSSFTAQQVGNLVVNGSFEEGGGSLAGWTVVDQVGGSGSWFAQSGTLSPLSGFEVPVPPDGSFAAMTDQFGPGSHILYQDITIPPGQGATLSFALFIGNRAADFSIPNPETLDFNVSPNQHFRADIMNPSAPVDDVGAGVLQNVFITQPGDPLVSGYTTITASLAFAGQTIRLRFAEVDNQLFFQAGIDNVNVQIVAIENKCPLGQGFWKNHPDAWPVTSLTLGSQTYTQLELLEILKTPVRGDASLILAHQLIAAKLNIANGSNPTPVSATIADADSLLSGFSGKLPYQVEPSSSTGQQMVGDANVLDAYNNGDLTPDCEP